jgi:hypothetical protein
MADYFDVRKIKWQSKRMRWADHVGSMLKIETHLNMLFGNLIERGHSENREVYEETLMKWILGIGTGGVFL